MTASGKNNGKHVLSSSGQAPDNSPMTLKQLRHDIRNHLNAIKLSCALLSRKQDEEMARESIKQIDCAADGISELVTRCLGEADSPDLMVATYVRDSQPAYAAPSK